MPDTIDVTYQGSTYTVPITPTASMFKVVVGGYNRSDFGIYPSVIVGVNAAIRVRILSHSDLFNINV